MAHCLLSQELFKWISSILSEYSHIYAHKTWELSHLQRVAFVGVNEKKMLRSRKCCKSQICFSTMACKQFTCIWEQAIQKKFIQSCFFSLSLPHLFLLLLFTRLVFFLASSYSSCKSIKTMLTPCIWFASCHTPTISNGRYFLTMPAK